MAKDKQKKKKERERRVAKQKLAEAKKRREQEKTSTEAAASVAKPKTRMTSIAVPKPDYNASKSTYTRGSGGKRTTILSYGHCWVIVSVWVPFPWNPLRGIALPVRWNGIVHSIGAVGVVP